MTGNPRAYCAKGNEQRPLGSCAGDNNDGEKRGDASGRRGGEGGKDLGGFKRKGVKMSAV